MESELPRIFGNDPLKLLAEEASPKLIHDWIDQLYESEFVLDRTMVFKIYTIAAIAEHIETYPLNDEYMQKFLSVAELAAIRGEELMGLMQMAHE